MLLKVLTFALLNSLVHYIEAKHLPVLHQPSYAIPHSLKTDNLHSEQDTVTLMQRNGAVNNNVDAIIAVSLGKINDLFSKEYQQKQTMWKDYSSKIMNPDVADPNYAWMSINASISSPLLSYASNANSVKLTMTMKPGSTAQLSGKDPVDISNTKLWVVVALSQVQGEVIQDIAVCMSFVGSETFGTDMNDITSLRLPESLLKAFKSNAMKFFSFYFTKKGVYCLGSIVLNPGEQGFIPALKPEKYAQQIVPDYVRPGSEDGFLVFFVLTQNSHKHLNDLTLPKFNLVPDGRDAAVIVANDLFINRILVPGCAQKMTMSVTTDPARKILTVSDGVVTGLGQIFNAEGPCKVVEGQYLQHYCIPTVGTPIEVKGRELKIAPSVAATDRMDMSFSTKKMYTRCPYYAPFVEYVSCTPTPFDDTMITKSHISFAISGDNVVLSSQLDSVGTFPAYTVSSDFHAYFNHDIGLFNPLGLDSWYDKEVAQFIDINSLNLLRLNTVVFPNRNILAFKTIHMLGDLVVFSDIVGS